MKASNLIRRTFSFALAFLTTMGLLAIRMPVVHADLPSPSWWHNTVCDTADYSGAYSLGTTYNGVTACGPRPIGDNGTDLTVHFFSGAWGENEWECVELVMRYMYLAYSINPYNAPGGKDVVGNYSGSTLTRVTNNGASLPSLGDILSESATSDNAFGHTAVVTAVNVTSGSGTVSVMEQNNSSSGSNTISVSSGVLQSNVTGWLHNPAASTITWWASTSGVNGSRTQVADVALLDGTENMFTVSSTGHLKLKWWSPSSGWSSWVDLGVSASPLETISVIRTPDNHWDVYGLADNGHLYQDEYVSGWSGWTDYGAPSSAINGFTSKVYPTDKSQFIYATTADGHLWQINSSGGGALGSWIDRGVPSSNLIGTPSELITTDKHIYIFALSTNGHLWQKDWSAGVWGSFIDRGIPTSSLTNSPSTVLSGDGTIDIFSESSSDGHIWEKRWNGSWTNWIDHGAQGAGFIGSPSVVLSPDDHKDMYAVSANGHLWQRDWTAGADWTGWIDRGTPTGITFSGSPNALLRPDNNSQDIYLVGSDGHMWQKNYDAPSHTWSWIDRGAF